MFICSIGNIDVHRARRRLRRGKRAQMTQVASFGPLVSVFFFFPLCFLYTNYYSFHLQVIQCIIHDMEKYWRRG